MPHPLARHFRYRERPSAKAAPDRAQVQRELPRDQREKGWVFTVSPDWSIGGSQNLLDELRFARHVDDGIWGRSLTSKQLVQMVTTNAARVLGLQGVLGSLEAGKKADLMVIKGDTCTPYDALLAATPADVQLVMIGGDVLYGDAALASLPPTSPACEALTICSAAKFVCVAAPSTEARGRRSTWPRDATAASAEAALGQHNFKAFLAAFDLFRL